MDQLRHFVTIKLGQTASTKILDADLELTALELDLERNNIYRPSSFNYTLTIALFWCFKSNLASIVSRDIIAGINLD